MKRKPGHRKNRPFRVVSSQEAYEEYPAIKIVAFYIPYIQVLSRKVGIEKDLFNVQSLRRELYCNLPWFMASRNQRESSYARYNNVALQPLLKKRLIALVRRRNSIPFVWLLFVSFSISLALRCSIVRPCSYNRSYSTRTVRVYFYISTSNFNG